MVQGRAIDPDSHRKGEAAERPLRIGREVSAVISSHNRDSAAADIVVFERVLVIFAEGVADPVVG